jgi:hypothetical protein
VLFRSGLDEVEPILEEKMKVGKMMEKCKFNYRIFSFHFLSVQSYFFRRIVKSMLQENNYYEMQQKIRQILNPLK